MSLYDDALTEFTTSLRRFGGAAYNTAYQMPNQASEQPYPTVSITVDQIEVTLHPAGLDQRDVHFDRTGFLTDEQTQRAYEILAERHSRELDEIATAIAKGELA